LAPTTTTTTTPHCQNKKLRYTLTKFILRKEVFSFENLFTKYRQMNSGPPLYGVIIIIIIIQKISIKDQRKKSISYIDVNALFK
jgi:hypothetical protein